MKALWSAAGMVTVMMMTGANAEALFELKGKHYACKDASTMNLWSISGDSELIRYQMLQKDYCWKTIRGLAVTKIGETKQFAHVKSPNNDLDFFVYKSDVGIFRPPAEKPPAVEKTEIRKNVRFLSVQNSTNFGVEIIKGKPTVKVEFDADLNLTVNFSIIKEKLIAGFDERISNHQGPNLIMSGKCKGAYLGLAAPDYFQVKVLAVDRVKRLAEFEVSGRWKNCDPSRSLTFEILPTTFRVDGEQFDQLIRPHTAAEMRATIGSKK